MPPSGTVHQRKPPQPPHPPHPPYRPLPDGYAPWDLVDAGGVQLRAEAAEAYQQLQNRDSFPQLSPFLAGPALARERTIERS